jgi:hypothetical protein
LGKTLSQPFTDSTRHSHSELPRRKRRGIKSFLGKRIAASREVSDPIWKNEKGLDYL